MKERARRNPKERIQEEEEAYLAGAAATETCHHHLRGEREEPRRDEVGCERGHREEVVAEEETTVEELVGDLRERGGREGGGRERAGVLPRVCERVDKNTAGRN